MTQPDYCILLPHRELFYMAGNKCMIFCRPTLWHKRKTNLVQEEINILDMVLDDEVTRGCCSGVGWGMREKQRLPLVADFKTHRVPSLQAPQCRCEAWTIGLHSPGIIRRGLFSPRFPYKPTRKACLHPLFCVTKTVKWKQQNVTAAGYGLDI